MRTVVSVLATVALIYAGLCAFLFATQRSQIYFPTAAPSYSVDAEALRLAGPETELKIWAVRRSGTAAIVYFGGNAEDVAGNVEPFSAAFPDRSLYLVNYRGYAGTRGRPTEAGLKADALAIFDHVRGQHEQVAVIGRSLGSGIATHLASQRPVDRLVLVTPFDSLVKVAQGHFRYLPVRLLMLDRYESAALAGNVKAPVLVVIAAEDEIIPRARSDALAGAFAASQVQVEVVPGARHNTLDMSPRYLAAVSAFLAGS